MKPTIRQAKSEDVQGITACHRAAYAEEEDLWDARLFDMQLTAFPQGQFVAVIDDQIVGYATSLIVQLDDGQWYKDEEITGSGSFATHTPSGDTLYGADIAVHPDFWGRGIAGLLYHSRKVLLRRFNLRRMVASGRIPGYAEVAGRYSAEEYVDLVVQGERSDPALTTHLKAGYRVRRVLLDFVEDDASLNYCTLLELENPDFDPAQRRIAAAPLSRPVRKVRVGAAQFLMRKIQGWDDVVENAEFFARAASEYHCHFLVLPEYFAIQYLSALPPETEKLGHVRALAARADDAQALVRDLARRYHLHIVAGSHLVQRDGGLYNDAWFVTPSGQLHTQPKLHITPSERQEWGIRPGETLRVFDTPLGRIGILICYDVEFPELSRLLAQSGIEVLFVPFSTDDRKAYYRVRYCAHARAIENSIYVVLSGSTGNLHGHHNYLLNYGRSAIITPSDFGFPEAALAGEGEGNTETLVIADLDLTSLDQHRQFGSVRPLRDQRHDIYHLEPRIKVERVRTD